MKLAITSPQANTEVADFAGCAPCITSRTPKMMKLANSSYGYGNLANGTYEFDPLLRRHDRHDMMNI